MPFVYQSGETIMHGDRVLYCGNPGEIEFVIDPRGNAEDRQAEYDWYMEAHGGGVMILEPKVFGRVFIVTPVDDDEDLVFVSRAT